jgi:H+/Cl- antiporter ClcA
VLRRIVAIIVLVPLAIVIIAFAVANRQIVTISFDPFDPAQPMYSTATWLFLPILGALILGVVIGGAGSWAGQGRWRASARKRERDVQVLRSKLSAYEAMAGSQSPVGPANEPSSRLRLRPPA